LRRRQSVNRQILDANTSNKNRVTHCFKIICHLGMQLAYYRV